jgi:hypothetical protein
MANFPNSPRLTKGALVSFDLPSPVPQVIIFQFNPENLTRTVQPQYGEREGEPRESLRLKGAPIESISVDIELDATDQLEHPDQYTSAVTMGVYPQLSALEMIIYPKTTGIIANAALAMAGIKEIVPPEGPFTIFVWGAKRALPVRVTSLQITEEAFDTNLNPTRVKASLGLQVLSYNNLKTDHPGYAMYLTNHITKEAMAAVGTVNSLSNLKSII